MKIIEARNVNDAYRQGIDLILKEGDRGDSRAGEVLVAPYPVVTVYHTPVERVLFDHRRDANPFFHLFEALWMLAGRNDATWLDRFVSDFSKRFAETDPDGYTYQHGAYGWRWRTYFNDSENYEGGDQLQVCVDMLRKNRADRRVVLAMWDTSIDLSADAKDVPCNTHIYPRIRFEPIGAYDVLDLTVLCRSNDIIWGAYGANAVHFSILQEYLASRIGVGVGKLYQFSNNWHAYRNVLDKVSPPATIPDPYGYVEYPIKPFPLGNDWDCWDDELRGFMEWTDEPERPAGVYRNEFFTRVVVPMFFAHWYWKAGSRETAMNFLREMPDSNDWKAAANLWMVRRMK